MLDKLAAASSSGDSASQPVAAALRLQAAMHSAIGFIAQQDRCNEHVVPFIAEAPALLPQVQRALALLPDTSAPGDSGSSSSSSAGGSSSAGSVATILAAVVPLQQALLQLIYDWRSDVSVHVDVVVRDALLASDSLAEAAMQLLCAYTYVIYDKHTAAAAAAAAGAQQQQLGVAFIDGLPPRGDSSADAAVSGSSSSSRSSSACSTLFKRPVQIGLLPISPVHKQLQLLPAVWRQLYLQEAQKAAQDGTTASLLMYMQAALHVLFKHTGHAHCAVLQQQQQHCQQQQQQEERDLTFDSTPAAAATASELRQLWFSLPSAD
jgi:hypothetical protein